MKCICNNCMNFPCTEDMSTLLKSCPAYSPKPKPQTNADRIRSMTDEELAEWIYKAEGDPALVIREQNDWLDWLKEEAKE